MFNVSCLMYLYPQNLHSNEFIDCASSSHEITRVNSWFQLYRVNFLLFPWQNGDGYAFVGWTLIIRWRSVVRLWSWSTLSQPHAELIKRSLTGSDISKYNKSWPHVTSSISEWKKPSGKVELLIITQMPPFRTSWLYLVSPFTFQR